MSDGSYLIALALIEQEGRRQMPLGGKSLKSPICTNTDLDELSANVLLQLLIRLMQRSKDGPFQISAGERSLLLVEMSINDMQEKLPGFKAEWLKVGNTNNFLSHLKDVCKGIWIVEFEKYKGISFTRI